MQWPPSPVQQILKLNDWYWFYGSASCKAKLSSGERLTELGLSSLLEASRTPVRLALERLANEGLLDGIPTGGFRVHYHSASLMFGMQSKSGGCWKARRLDSLRNALKQPKNSRARSGSPPKPCWTLQFTIERFAQYLDVNKSFHRELWSLAKSPSLFRELEQICKIPFAAPDALVFTIADREQSTAFVAAEQHRAIVEAIENREGTRAEALAREHSRISRRNLEFALRSKEILSDRLPGAALITNLSTNKEPT